MQKLKASQSVLLCHFDVLAFTVARALLARECSCFDNLLCHTLFTLLSSVDFLLSFPDFFSFLSVMTFSPVFKSRASRAAFSLLPRRARLLFHVSRDFSRGTPVPHSILTYRGFGISLG